MTHPDDLTDADLGALGLVVPRVVTVTGGPGRVRLTLSARRDAPPLVTWALIPTSPSAPSRARLAEWAEYLGATAETALQAIGEDHAAPAEERIRRIADGTANAAQVIGDDMRVEVEEIHTHDPTAWFG